VRGQTQPVLRGGSSGMSEFSSGSHLRRPYGLRWIFFPLPSTVTVKSLTSQSPAAFLAEIGSQAFNVAYADDRDRQLTDSTKLAAVAAFLVINRRLNPFSARDPLSPREDLKKNVRQRGLFLA